jgi:hypothetical protein
MGRGSFTRPVPFADIDRVIMFYGEYWIWGLFYILI